MSSTSNNGNDGLIVVGIGASAGGIKAFREFFSKVPAQSGMAYVVILHLSPEHDSKLAEVIQFSSHIPVTQVVDRTELRPDHIYVIPPNRSLSMVDGYLAVSEVAGFEERRAPVDIFFRTLAESKRSQAVCVVLSGTGANGSMGMKRVKEMGGIAIAQEPKEAEYSDMPRNSIATGLVDYVLPVAEIPEKILAYKSNLGASRLATHSAQQTETEAQALREVFTQLRLRTGHDFSNYKRATILRRIERRINVHELSDLPAYARFIRENPNETSALLKDLLISVTNFFRDPDSFKALEENIVPKIFEGRQADEHIRVWVPGCATGEEAYSIAMILSDFTANLINGPGIQIFATDIDEQAISAARDGFYSEADVADVSPERLRRFFTKEVDGYRVRRELREMVLFAAHNIIKDPPFSRLDLVSCRTLLIYLNRTAQEKVMDILHFALRPGRYLFLGTSESVNGTPDVFIAADKEHHIFQSRAVSVRMTIPIPDSGPTIKVTTLPKDERRAEAAHQDRLSYYDLHQRLLELYGPPSVIVNENYDVLHLSEQAGRYLTVQGGEPSTNLLKMVRPELRIELRTALYQALQNRTTVEAKGLRVSTRDQTNLVNLIVRPAVREDDPARGLFLVIFEESKVSDTDDSLSNGEVISPVEPALHQLENELVHAKGQLRATVEQYEVQHEELKASNEELQAMNEELRSAAEELETSKEELQSINEELTTVNQELKIKIEELSQANNDFQNLMASTEIGTIFLDRSLRVKLFTARARDFFNLIPADTGRPLLDITHKLLYDKLVIDVEQVLDTLHTVEREIQTYSGRWCLLRILPYRTTEDRIVGAVLTFIDITERKHAEERSQRLTEQIDADRRRLEAILQQMPAGVFMSDASGRLVYANPQVEEILGKPFGSIDTPEVFNNWHVVDANTGDPVSSGRMPIYRSLEEGEIIRDEELMVRRPDGTVGIASMSTSPLRDAEGNIVAAVATLVDLAERKKLEEELKRARDQMERRVQERTKELAEANSALNKENIERRHAEQRATKLFRRLVTVQEDERLRMARDLHDQLGQQLTALRLTLELLKTESGGDQKLSENIRQAQSIAQRLDADIDFLAWELRPSGLDKLGLSTALSNYVEEWSRHFEVASEFHTSGFEKGRLTSEAETNLYRITQEALNNIHKHAEATRVDVILERRGDYAALIIEDNGKGFELPHEMSTLQGEPGLGIVGMRERAALIGGSLEIESELGKGTTIFVRIPLSTANEI